MERLKEPSQNGLLAEAVREKQGEWERAEEGEGAGAEGVLEGFEGGLGMAVVEVWG